MKGVVGLELGKFLIPRGLTNLNMFSDSRHRAVPSCVASDYREISIMCVEALKCLECENLIRGSVLALNLISCSSRGTEQLLASA